MSCCNCPTSIPLICAGIPNTCPPIGFDINAYRYIVSLDMLGFLQQQTFIFRMLDGCSFYALQSQNISVWTDGVHILPCTTPALGACASLLQDPGDFFPGGFTFNKAHVGCGFGDTLCIIVGQSIVRYTISFNITQNSCRGCSTIGLTIRAICTHYPEKFRGPDTASFSASYSAIFPAFCNWDIIQLLPSSISRYTFGGSTAGPTSSISMLKLRADYYSLPTSISITKQ